MEPSPLSVPFRALGSTAQIPALGLGTWKSEPGKVYDAVRTAIQLGYRHIDCAFAYDNEAEIGDAIGDAIAAGEVTRAELFITSKLWNSFHQADMVAPALQQSLSALKLDYLDLYLIHWPVAFRAGVGFPGSGEDFLSLEQVPLLETWQAMEACVDSGLVRQIGVSNFSQQKLQALMANARIKPVNNQVELHPYLQQPELVRYCHEHGVQITAYAPLGSMDRPEFLKNDTDPNLLAHPLINAIATKHGASAAQILLAWSLARDVVVIPKSVNPDRLAENLAATHVVLDDEDMAQIGELDQHYRCVTGAFWQMPGSPYTIATLWDE
ncbi:aldo/keto reductase [Ferrimonas pelagia]|uniref:Aldo/keto reductase n=1 Tax=Ferrimonas pelagia TaxID=1177826 RepID=A0ABP9F320_9GAMM